MYATFNMGIGYCIVVAKSEQQAALDALKGPARTQSGSAW